MKFSPDRLKQARKLAGYTQATLAAALKGHARTVQDWEYGRMSPRGEMLKQISLVLGKPTEYFFEAKEDHKAKDLVQKGEAVQPPPLKDLVQMSHPVPNPYAPPPALTHKAMPGPTVAKKLRRVNDSLLLAIKESAAMQMLLIEGCPSEAETVQIRRHLAKLQGVIAEAQDQLDKAMRGEE